MNHWQCLLFLVTKIFCVMVNFPGATEKFCSDSGCGKTIAFLVSVSVTGLKHGIGDFDADEVFVSGDDGVVKLVMLVILVILGMLLVLLVLLVLVMLDIVGDVGVGHPMGRGVWWAAPVFASLP